MEQKMEQKLEQKTELKMIKLSEVQSQEIEWLWFPFIPYGKLTIIQGDPGDGKTTLVLNLAAKLSKGEGMDENMSVLAPINIIYQTAEDGLWSYVKKKYKLNVTNFLCSERSLTCYFYCILLDVFKILFLIFIWRQISTMTVNAHGIVKCFDVFKNQFMCMCIIKDFKPVDPFSLQKCMERFDTGVIPWICFL